MVFGTIHLLPVINAGPERFDSNITTAASMSAPVEITSFEQFVAMVQTSTVLVADCKRSPPIEDSYLDHPVPLTYPATNLASHIHVRVLWEKAIVNAVYLRPYVKLIDVFWLE